MRIHPFLCLVGHQPPRAGFPSLSTELVNWLYSQTFVTYKCRRPGLLSLEKRVREATANGEFCAHVPSHPLPDLIGTYKDPVGPLIFGEVGKLDSDIRFIHIPRIRLL